MTGISISLIVDGVVTSTTQSFEIIFPAIGAVILKTPYERYKSLIISNLSKLLKLDIVVSLIASFMLFSNNNILQKWYIIIMILFCSTFQIVINYSYIDLKCIFFKNIQDEQDYTNSDTQIRSFFQIFGYALSILVAPWLPIWIQMVLLMLSNCAGSVTMLYILHITDYHTSTY